MPTRVTEIRENITWLKEFGGKKRKEDPKREPVRVYDRSLISKDYDMMNADKSYF